MRMTLLTIGLAISHLGVQHAMGQVWSVEILPNATSGSAPNASAGAVSGNRVVGNSSSRGFLWTRSSPGVWTVVENSTYRFTGISGSHVVGNPASRWDSSYSGLGTQLPVPSIPFTQWVTSGVSGDTIVGYSAINPATYDLQGIVWTPDPNSSGQYIYNLLPTGSGLDSFVYGTDGSKYVGRMEDASENVPMATVWESLTSYQHLSVNNPDDKSVAFDVDGDQIVGFVEYLDSNTELVRAAALWPSTTASPILLSGNPGGGDVRAEALAVHLGVQVGYTNEYTGQDNAMLWAAGSPSVPVASTNLHSLLESSFPQVYEWSQATGVWVESGDPGQITVSGFARLAASSTIHPVVWIREISCDCPANFVDATGSYCVLNFFDIAEFIRLYGLQDSEADLYPPGNPDGVWNFFDVSQYLQYFNAGCGTT